MIPPFFGSIGLSTQTHILQLSQWPQILRWSLWWKSIMKARIVALQLISNRKEMLIRKMKQIFVKYWIQSKFPKTFTCTGCPFRCVHGIIWRQRSWVACYIRNGWRIGRGFDELCRSSCRVQYLIYVKILRRCKTLRYWWM